MAPCSHLGRAPPSLRPSEGHPQRSSAPAQTGSPIWCASSRWAGKDTRAALCRAPSTHRWRDSPVRALIPSCFHPNRRHFLPCLPTLSFSSKHCEGGWCGNSQQLGLGVPTLSLPPPQVHNQGFSKEETALLGMQELRFTEVSAQIALRCACSSGRELWVPRGHGEGTEPETF